MARINGEDRMTIMRRLTALTLLAAIAMPASCFGAEIQMLCGANLGQRLDRGGDIAWRQDTKEALEAARKARRPAILYFTHDG